MIREALLKEVGKKIDIKEVQDKIKKFCSIEKICEAFQLDGINVVADEKFLYVSSNLEIPKISDKLNNRVWLEKIARHRIFEDCKKCKYLDEEKHLGKMWCEKWDTDIWNVSTPFPADKHKVNQGCVPFRYFGYAPNMPHTQGQYGLAKEADKKNIIKKFIVQHDLEDVGNFFEDENIFAGEFDPQDRFGLKFNPETNTIEMVIEVGDQRVDKEYQVGPAVLDEMHSDWREGWGFNYTKADALLNQDGPRQETNYDWTTSEEYKQKHNKQKTKQYEISPQNVGDKYDSIINFGPSDKDIGNA